MSIGPPDSIGVGRVCIIMYSLDSSVHNSVDCRLNFDVYLHELKYLNLQFVQQWRRDPFIRSSDVWGGVGGWGGGGQA